MTQRGIGLDDDDEDDDEHEWALAGRPQDHGQTRTCGPL